METTQNKTEETNEKEIISQIWKEKTDYEQASLEIRNDINDIYSVYSGRADKVKRVPYRNKETVPKLRTEIAYVVPFIFSGNPEIEVEGVGPEDKTVSQILEKIVNYRIQQSIPYAYEKIESWVKQAVTFGTSIMKVIWRFSTETQTDEKGNQYEVPVVDEPDLEVSNILDIYYNPLVPDIDAQPSIIFRSLLPVKVVQDNATYNYIGEFVDENGDPMPNRLKVEARQSFSSNVYDSTSQVNTDQINVQMASTGLVEVYERVTADRIQTIADGRKRLLLRDEKNPYGMNAVKLIHEPNCIPNRFNGIGVGHNTLGLGKLYYKMINQTLDNITLTNNPMFLFKKGAGIDARQLVAKPGGGISVDGEPGQPISNYIQPVPFTDVKQGAIQILNKLDDEHKRASGANDLVQGAASNKTLGQDQLASSYVSNRFELIQRRFKQSLADVAELIIKMELHNLQSPDAPILRIFPQELRVQIYQLLINDAKNVKYNIRVKGDTIIAKNKEIMLKEFREWLNQFMPILPPQYQMECARKWLEMRGIDDIDKLVPDPQTMAQPMNPQMMPNPMAGAMPPTQQ